MEDHSKREELHNALDGVDTVRAHVTSATDSHKQRSFARGIVVISAS